MRQNADFFWAERAFVHFGPIFCTHFLEWKSQGSKGFKQNLEVRSPVIKKKKKNFQPLSNELNSKKKKKDLGSFLNR